MALLSAVGYAFYRHFLAPTHILVVNALEAQQADLVLNNDSRHIDITCVDAEQMGSLRGYDAIVVYARRLFLTDEQTAALRQAAARGVPIFTKSLRSSPFVESHNLTAAQIDTLQLYLDNNTQHNYRNALRYLRHIATPQRWGDQQAAPPMVMPRNLYYHRRYGQYFSSDSLLTAYLRRSGLYNEPTAHPTANDTLPFTVNGQRVALISGITFPTEGNRQHIDTLITLLTRRGFNVYPLCASGKHRATMLRQLRPDAIVYLPMGRIGNDTLTTWLQQHNIPIFSPYPISTPHEKWMVQGLPLSSGTKNARIVIPEIDGAIAPYCIATQRSDAQGFYRHVAEVERCVALADHIARYLSLRTKANSEKRIAIGYFRRPGHDALLASGMEVIPSLYNFLLRLRNEGYNVDGLPATLSLFAHQVKREGLVLGSYAPAAQQRYLSQGRPVWLSRQQYEQWVHQVIPTDKYAEVVSRYGEAPGQLLARGDSLAVACLRYGNVLLFPQPRPALGDDDFRLVHGAEVAPPHSYLAPYLYVQCGFRADAIVHFGTHGNLEFTPGRDVAMRPSDWSQQLIGTTPHFYYYTTGNVGEAIIAKRRSHAVLVTYLTPPYAESGMRQRYGALHALLHRALQQPGQELARQLRRRIVAEGLHRVLDIDSTLATPLTPDELQRIDNHIEELMGERMQGAFYTLGQPYSDEQLRHTVAAMSDDRRQWPRLRQLLLASTQSELTQMVAALSGGAVAPTPGGDPVLNANVLPTGRNMYSINPENTPDATAWDDGRRLAEATLQRYKAQHGHYPRQVSYTFWAGEFIASGGATIAQALWMLGVEPERDGQGRIGSLRLVPRQQLGRPRVNVMVQVSGQLRDIADSRLRLITDAIRLASAEDEDSNYVRLSTLDQERQLVDQGMSPQQARQLSTLRVFGPVNSGYSTGMMDFIERSGRWDSTAELSAAYLNNMCAAYADEQHWGMSSKELFAAALRHTDVVVQPRQSNTWGPVSLDHVYEFAGGLSMAVKQLSGREPDALMADYRNPRNRRLQGMKEAVDVELRTTVLNPLFIRERMKGDEGTAQMFGEVFRNIFGWSVTRPSTLDPQLFDQLYHLYVTDEQGLGIRQYFMQKNPAAYQAITATMLESARKGYWHPTASQLATTATLHAAITGEAGAACTDFVCNNAALQHFVARQLPAAAARSYNQQLAQVKGGEGASKGVVLQEQGTAAAGQASSSAESATHAAEAEASGLWTWTGLVYVGIALVLLWFTFWLRRNHDSRH